MPKPVCEIAAYINAVTYTFPCGCYFRCRYGVPINQSPEEVKSCRGGHAVMGITGGIEFKKKGGDICGDAMMYVIGDIKRRQDAQQDDGRLKRSWYTPKT